MSQIHVFTNIPLKRFASSKFESLHALIEQGIAKEGYIGMALLGGAVTVTGVVLTALLRRGRR